MTVHASMGRTRRQLATALAVGLIIGMPAVAYLAAPASATSKAKSAGAPGSRLAGINSSATGSGAQVVFFAPGIVPVGDSKIGRLVQASLPYTTTTGGTGPSTTGLAAPAWPGDVAANGGNSIQTFIPTVPKQLVGLLNDPVAAHSTYPAQLNTHASGSYAPPGGKQAGVGTASTTSAKSGTTSKAAVNNTSPLGSIAGGSSLVSVLTPILKGPVGGILKGLGVTPKVTANSLLTIGSATSQTVEKLDAGSVGTSAKSRVSNVVIAGIVKIDGVSSNTYSATNGRVGSQHSHLHVGKVTVAGIPASIGPKGLSLDKKGVGSSGAAINQANNLLKGLKKAGISIATIKPVVHKKGSAASVTSGAVQIEFAVKSVPNLAATIPQLPLPLPNSAAIDVDLGYSQTSVDATRLPPIGPPVKQPPVKTTHTTGPGSSDGGGASGGGTGVTSTGGDGGTLPGGGGTTSGGGSGGGENPILAAPVSQTVFGIPTRVAWVVLALLLSLMIAGPLLAYANWQLLRGRTS